MIRLVPPARNRLVALALTAVALAVVACSENAPPGPSAELQAVIDEGGVYVGEITTTVDAYAVCAQGEELQHEGQEVYAFPVAVRVGPPLAGDDAAETNPLNVIVGPPGLGPAAPVGTLLLVSAEDFDTVGGVRLLQYWVLAVDGEVLSGELVATHDDKQLAYNVLAGQAAFFPCQPERGIGPRTWVLQPGATMSGTLTPERIEIVIEGESEDGRRIIRAEVVATR